MEAKRRKLTPHRKGDVVQLNSGGPLMTIADIVVQENSALLSLMWATRDGVVLSAEISPYMVTRIRRAGKGIKC